MKTQEINSKINSKFYILIFTLLIFNSNISQGITLFQNNSIPVIINSDTLLNPWTGGMNAVQISTIDLNNDQVEDLFIFDKTGNKILTFINNGENYLYEPKYETLFPSELEDWVLLRDFNGDDKKDIFGSVSGGIGVWKNNSSDVLSFESLEFWHLPLNDYVPYILSDYVYIDSNWNSSTGEIIIDTVISTSNIYVSYSDIPDINDIDNDGDLDILTFGVTGTRLEYHRNKSIELGYGKDSLIFELKNDCWGHFSESGLTNTCTLYDTCNSIINNPQTPLLNDRNQLRHSGSTVLSLDLNNDSVRDLILGDVSFNNLVALFNDDKGVNMNTSMVDQDTSFPSNSIPANIYMFPAAFYEDLNNDGIKDLIVSPNSDSETANKESIWYYENAGTNNLPLLYLQKKNIIQETTIEIGRGARPILVDINNDTLMDLLIANFGEFDITVPIHYRSYVQSFINVGTNEFPIFSKLSDNFQNLSNLINEINLQPTFGDLDDDGDLDAIVGDFNGKLHYLENNPSNNGEMNLIIKNSPLKDEFNNIFDFGYCSHPTLFDIDNDNDLDLIVGEARGNLNFIENTGSKNNFNFELQYEEFGGVDVSEWWTNLGSSTPIFNIENNELILYVGTERGTIFKYNNIENNISGNFNLIDSSYLNINNGPNSSLAIANLNRDSTVDFIIGNKRGGLSLYLSGLDTITSSTIKKLSKEKFKIFPNPIINDLNINNKEKVVYSIFDITGKMQMKIHGSNLINANGLNHGIYFLHFELNNENFVLKFIK